MRAQGKQLARELSSEIPWSWFEKISSNLELNSRTLSSISLMTKINEYNISEVAQCLQAKLGFDFETIRLVIQATLSLDRIINGIKWEQNHKNEHVLH